MSQPVEPGDHPLEPADDDSDLRYDHRTTDADDEPPTDEDED
jgi:hypothetical protein